MKKRKRTVRQTKSERFKEGVNIWVGFYRANIHRFARDYMELSLHPFQEILLYLMNQNTFFMYIASRAQGKSFLIAIFCVARCILYPGTKVAIASGSKGQGKLIITQKVADLMRDSVMVSREIAEIKTSANDTEVIFHNGSRMMAVVSGDGARGVRGNILILDEFFLIKKTVVNKVLRPFLGVSRQPPYMKIPKYANTPLEEDKELYISSATYKNNWIWDSFKSFRNSMLRGKSYFCCALPYQLSIKHNILSKQRIEQLKSEDDFDPIGFYMEYETMFFGESERAFYKLEDIQNCRKIVKPVYPMNDVEYLESKDKKIKSTKQKGEKRILSCDIALMGSSRSISNDLSVFTYIRLIPDDNGYKRYVSYMESFSGEHSQNQAIRMKQLFYEFECDICVIDTQGKLLPTL